MNTQTIKGNWMQLKGEIRETWGKLTENDMEVIAGERDQLIGKIRERYGKTVEVIDREVQEFETRLSTRKNGSKASECRGSARTDRRYTQ